MSRQPTMPSVSWETNSTPVTTPATTTEQSVTTTLKEEEKDIPSANVEKDKAAGEGEKGMANHSVENYHQFDLQLEDVQKPLASELEKSKTPATRQRKGMSLTEYRKRYGAMQS